VYKTGLADAFMAYTGWKRSLADPYFVPGSQQLIRLFEETSQVKGITLSTPGFYAPQLRSIRLRPADPDLIEKIGSFTYQGMHINNFEMESSALYALSAMMGHDALTLCVAIANRISKDFLEDYKTAINKLIRMVLEKLTSDD
jgi:uridine phosphorylase